MAHKTLVGGTAYNISGGKSMVSGTVYNIKGGKTLIDGTAYSISLGVEILPVLNDNDWATISEVSQSGQAANYWSVGDTKQIIISGTVGQTTFSDLSVWSFILGFNHNSAKEGNNTIHFQIGKTAQTGGTDVCLTDSRYNSSALSTAGYFTMNYSSTNIGGWGGSEMRNTLLGNNNTPASPLSGSLIAALPSDLRAVMKGVTKYSDNTGGGNNIASYVTATTDYLWLLAECEVFGPSYGYSGYGYANDAEKNYQQQYDYYANGNSKVKYRHSATSSAALWWLRSVFTKSSSIFICINTSGSLGTNYVSYYSRGVAPAFCV